MGRTIRGVQTFIRFVQGLGMDTAPPCRSWLASESGGSGDIDVECESAIAGKPAPTGFLGVSANRMKYPVNTGA